MAIWPSPDRLAHVVPRCTRTISPVCGVTVRILVALAAPALGAIQGCSPSKPAAATEIFHDPAEPVFPLALTSREDHQIEAGFGTVVAGHSATQVPQPAGPRGRWSDVPQAAVYACDEIEAAVVRQREEPWGWEFGIRTVEDWPGILTVRRVDDDRVYEASASIGWTNDRTQRETALLEALDKQMRAFGKKHRMPE